MSMLQHIANYFDFRDFDTNFKKEILAGCTTFVTMAYIIIVNPKILQAAGIPAEASMVATILTAFFGTLLMGVYANRPFAIAPYMGQNAFVAYTVVQVMGFSWQVALGGILISGILLTLLTFLNLRTWLMEAIPLCLKIAFSAGIGLFLIFIGLNETGIVRLGVIGAPVQVGDLSALTSLLAIAVFLLMSILLLKKINAALLFSILAATTIGFGLGLLQLPAQWISMPPPLVTFMALDIIHAIQIDFFPVILTTFILLFIDAMGTLVGLGYAGNFIDSKGNFPEIEKPIRCTAISTMIAPCLGTTSAGIYLESAAGIEAGGRTGFTAVVTACLFLFALFLTPILTLVPAYAYGPALIIIGMQMMTAIKNLNFDDLAQAIPALTMIALTTFTYDLGIGMAAGFIVYVLLQIIVKRSWKFAWGLWLIFFLSCLFFIFYPYR